MSEAPQRTDAWRQARLGCVTASRVADVIARTRTGWGSSRANYAAELIVERLTGIPQEGFTSAAMQHGIDCEPEARIAYEFWKNVTVTEVGFIPHPTIPMCGASPDGFLADDGLIEIKCVQTAKHLETLLGQPIDGRYLTQMQFQMAVTGRQFCDFISYDPRLPDPMRLFVQRVQRNDEQIEELEEFVRDFLGELNEKLVRLREMYVEPLLMAG